MATEETLTAEGVINAIVKKMEEDGQEFPDYIRAPGVYFVYLHKDDYRRLRDHEEEIKEQAKRKLDERISQLSEDAARHRAGKGLSGKLGNALGSLFSLSEANAAKSKKPYRKPEAEWEISLARADGSKMETGKADVHTKARVSPRPKPTTGNLTQVERGDKNSALKSAVKDYLTESVAAPSPKQPDPLRTAPLAPPVAPDRVYAVISFNDGRRPHTYEMRTPQIVIRCGERAGSADFHVPTPPELFSGELRLRYEEKDGEFYFQSNGQSGIKIGGQMLPAAADSSPARQAEVKLPPRARIHLAGVVVLDFKAY